MNNNVIFGINGPVVTVKDADCFEMMEMVHVGKQELVGEVIGITDSLTTIQVYEETTGLKPGDPVTGTGAPMNVLLGPGILDNIFDGIERPLKAIEAQTGAFIARGAAVSPLDPDRLWTVALKVKPGDRLEGGQVYATLPETPIIEHRVMLHPELSGVITEVRSDGEYRLFDTVAVPRLTPSIPLITGQRVMDTLFPIAKGGTAAIPGGFGTGKTMNQHQLAKWCDADIIIYVGCGERGNEMSQVLEEFSELIDPKSNRPMTDRTVLIANTSNMPVAAREASIYTGITLAEYYRDMGYHVAMMADSTSRWAEALREISGRLEEMPAEEGFPAYLPSRLAEFYERGGRADVLCGSEGSVTLIGAVSPQGSDFSEPVTQNTKRFTRVFWALDKALAYARHYPAINWMNSYSEYFNDLDPWFRENLGEDFVEYRNRISALLQEEGSLMEIVKLIGADVLPDDQKLVIETARVIRVGFLQQNAFHAEDTYVPLEKQKLMMKAILHLHAKAKEVVAREIPIARVIELGLFDKLTKMKYDIPNNRLDMFDDYIREIDEKLGALLQ